MVKSKNLSKSQKREVYSFVRKCQIIQKKISKNNMYYFTGYNSLHGEKNRKFDDIFVEKYYNDWISFLVQSLLYEEKKDKYIVYSIDLLTKKLHNMKIDARPEIKVNNNIIYDINFILLKLYEQYNKGDIEGQIKLLKIISYSYNITKNNLLNTFKNFIKDFPERYRHKLRNNR